MRKLLLWIGHRAINGITTGVFMLLFIAGVTYAINLTSVTTQTVSAPWSADAGWYQQVNDRLVNIFVSGANVGVGTASPAYKLDVSGDITSRGLLGVVNGNGNVNIGPRMQAIHILLRIDQHFTQIKLFM